MITRTFLANDLNDIKYFKLLSKFQYHIKHYMVEGTFVDRTPNDKNIFVKKSGSKKNGTPGLKECYDYIINNCFTEIETQQLEEFLRKYRVDKTKLVYDLSTNTLEIIGCSFSIKSFKYYEGCGYTLKYDKSMPRIYHNSCKELMFKRINDLDELVVRLPPICRNYYEVGMKSIKFEDNLLDEKMTRLDEFIKFLNITDKQLTYCMGHILLNIK